MISRIFLSVCIAALLCTSSVSANVIIDNFSIGSGVNSNPGSGFSTTIGVTGSPNYVFSGNAHIGYSFMANESFSVTYTSFNPGTGATTLGNASGVSSLNTLIVPSSPVDPGEWDLEISGTGISTVTTTAPSGVVGVAVAGLSNATDLTLKFTFTGDVGGAPVNTLSYGGRNLSLSAVPEPTSLVMFGTCLAGLLGRRRRR